VVTRRAPAPVACRRRGCARTLSGLATQACKTVQHTDACLLSQGYLSTEVPTVPAIARKCRTGLETAQDARV